MTTPDDGGDPSPHTRHCGRCTTTWSSRPNDAQSNVTTRPATAASAPPNTFNTSNTTTATTASPTTPGTTPTGAGNGSDDPNRPPRNRSTSRFTRNRCAKHSQHAVWPGTNNGPNHTWRPPGRTNNQRRPAATAAVFNAPNPDRK